MIDLTDYYNGSLTRGWIPTSTSATSEQKILAGLSTGVQVFAGVRFDVRGLVQLAGQSLNETLGASYPAQVDGIRVKRKCARLHFLHSTGWEQPEGTRIGHYLIHYAGGEQLQIAIVCGDNIRDWWFDPQSAETTANAVVAWTGKIVTLKKLDQVVRLYKFTWENPKPDLLIESSDFVSLNTQSSPFLIAITAEP